MLKAQSLSALVGDGEASERRNTVLDVSSSGSTSKHWGRDVATHDGTVPAEGQRLSLIARPPTEGGLLGGRLPPSPERIGCVVVTAAATEEHQGHQPAPDEERKEGSETKGDPAVLIHHGVASGVPY